LQTIRALVSTIKIHTNKQYPEFYQLHS
jgi:hypothetical protein